MGQGEGSEVDEELTGKCKIRADQSDQKSSLDEKPPRRPCKGRLIGSRGTTVDIRTAE